MPMPSARTYLSYLFIFYHCHMLSFALTQVYALKAVDKKRVLVRFLISLHGKHYHTMFDIFGVKRGMFVL